MAKGGAGASSKEAFSTSSVALWRKELLETKTIKVFGLAKELTGLLQVHVNRIANEPFTKPEYCVGEAIVSVDELSVDSDKKAGIASAQVLITSVSDIRSEFVYWGRVIDSQIAKHMPRNITIPVLVEAVDEENTTEFQVYIDGSHVLNTRRADCCLAWFCLPQKKDKPESKEGELDGGKGDAGAKDGMKNKTENGEGGDAAAASAGPDCENKTEMLAADESPQPKKKKRKSAASKGFKIVQVEPSHAVSYKSPAIVIAGTLCKEYRVRMPILVQMRKIEADDIPHVISRKRIEWDDTPVDKVQKTKASHSLSFALL